MVGIGDRVRVVGLRASAHHNGAIGMVAQYDGDRCLVVLQDGFQLKVRPENLEVLVRDSYGGQEVSRRQAGPEGDRENPLEDLGRLMAVGAYTVAKRNWKISLTWIVGLLVAFFFTGFAVSEDESIRYEMLLQSVDTDRLLHAEEQVQHDYARYYDSKGWLTCDDHCTKLKRRWEQSQAELEQAQQGVDAQISEAKKSVGLFSTYGVQETRELFWKRFGQGKQFAKNQSFWDLMFAGLFHMGRDEGLASFLLRLLINVLMNFTIGLVGAAIGFIWTLWSVVQTFQPGFLPGLLFFLLASVAACSFLATWLIGLYTAAAGGVFVLGKATGALRVEGGPNPRRSYVR